MEKPDFALLAAAPAPPLDELALALAAEFRPVDAPAALATLDALGEQLGRDVAGTPGTAEREADACAALLGGRHGFTGNRDRYDDPDNSMLDLVLERRTGLPILLSVVYTEVARRAGIALCGVGLPGHFVVAHLGAEPPVVLDPFDGGARLPPGLAGDAPRPWGAHETALRMLNNLVRAYAVRSDLERAIRAAELRIALPADPALEPDLTSELRALRARLN